MTRTRICCCDSGSCFSSGEGALSENRWHIHLLLNTWLKCLFAITVQDCSFPQPYFHYSIHHIPPFRICWSNCCPVKVPSMASQFLLNTLYAEASPDFLDEEKLIWINLGKIFCHLFPRFDDINTIHETKKKTEPNSIFTKIICTIIKLKAYFQNLH